MRCEPVGEVQGCLVSGGDAAQPRRGRHEGSNQPPCCLNDCRLTRHGQIQVCDTPYRGEPCRRGVQEASPCSERLKLSDAEHMAQVHMKGKTGGLPPAWDVQRVGRQRQASTLRKPWCGVAAAGCSLVIYAAHAGGLPPALGSLAELRVAAVLTAC